MKKNPNLTTSPNASKTQGFEEQIGYRWLSTSELPAHTGLSESLFEKLRAQDAGPPCVKIGRAIRYRSDQLDEWMSSCAVSKSRGNQ